MCGICVWFSCSRGESEMTPPQCWIARPLAGCVEDGSHQCTVDHTAMIAAIGRRGSENACRTIEVDDGVSLSGSVLHMQGTVADGQPVTIALDGGRTAYMCWNGEVFCGAPKVTGVESDTTAVASGIAAVLEATLGSDIALIVDGVRDVLEKVGGPFAVAVALPWLKTVLVSRDPLGRRSLVVHAATSAMSISSTLEPCHLPGHGVELGIDGVHAVLYGDTRPSLWLAAPWRLRHLMHPLVHPHSSLSLLGGSLLETFRALLSASSPQPPLEEIEAATAALRTAIDRAAFAFVEARDAPVDKADAYLSALGAAVWRRVRAATHRGDTAVTVLFSGGIDSTVLALLTAILVPPLTIVELVNVAFGNAAVAPDRQTCVTSFAEIVAAAPAAHLKLVFVDVDGAELAVHETHIMSRVYPCDSVMDNNIGTAIWFAARGVGIEVPHESAAAAARVSSRLVRLGGGATVLAAQGADDPWEAFVRSLIAEGCEPGQGLLLSDVGKDFSESVEGIIRATPGARRLRDALESTKGREYVSVVSMHNESGHRENAGNMRTVQSVVLRRPADVAAAKQVNLAKAELEPFLRAASCGGVPYVCASRVLILGMGADETLGGYVRHAKRFVSGGPEALAAELCRDFARLWQRNLGRDDRVVSDHRKEGRFPFLDEDVLATLSNVGIPAMTDVVDLSQPAGVGDKKLLRTVARRLGLTDGSRLVKRAVQFGTRIADRKVQGNTPLAEVGSAVHRALKQPRPASDVV